MRIKITVCELHNEPDVFAKDWQHLIEHVQHEQSQLVVLPEMPFSPWLGTTAQFEASRWQASVIAHECALTSLSALAPATVLSSHPLNRDGKRLNAGFSWGSQDGYRSIHDKYYLPNEEGVWEASWYERGNEDFTVQRYHDLCLGMLLCTELWALDKARAYGAEGAHLLVVPRTTERSTLDKWLVGGRAAAIVSGAFCASSNRVSLDGVFSGGGWVIDPDGNIICLTSPEQPCISVEIDLQISEQAKTSYPRYIFFTKSKTREE
ncbi:carbon-nitrogen hydrolase family protein [Dictyobacter arantiisoli]|uniref:CN hydrolase domain-containing protein n=1 Tax=Dictyobacter arantiisoli TaxID=2014874 RepID=A0A5A5TGK6_9CHLR|nr:carbon-nitrogen hydrolase family protein [Dictyobacter arantiisoli]GCF10365.1 hypothetical protein KDI_39290 [Dictyobacter arantiisoli]